MLQMVLHKAAALGMTETHAMAVSPTIPTMRMTSLILAVLALQGCFLF